MRFHTIFIIGLLSAIAAAQSVDDQRIAWSGRIENLKSRGIQEAERSDPIHRAYFYARLGDLWWEIDNAQASAWFEKAVDTLIYKAENKSGDNPAFLETSRELLKIISMRSPKQTKRLTDLLLEPDKISEKDKKTNAEVLIEFALLACKDDPKKAFDIGSLAFRTQQPSNFYRLYWEFRRKDAALADRFFNIAITSARLSPTPGGLSALKAAVFPELILPGAPENLRSPPAIRMETLQFFSDFLIESYVKVQGKSAASCESEGLQVSALKAEVESVLPHRAALFSHAINECLGAVDQSKKDLAGFSPANTNNIDELLKLAADSKDIGAKAYYLFRAANVANDSKNYRRALNILDGMDRETRSYDPKFWEELRYTSSAGRAHQQVIESDFAGAINTLNSVSVEYRAFANIGFALKFSSKDISYSELVLERTRAAASLIERSELPFIERSGFWFKIVEIFSQREQHGEASAAFKAIVRGFNKAYSEEKPKPILDSRAALASPITPELLESQDAALIDSVNSIADSRTLLDTYLGMLSIAAKHYSVLLRTPSARRSL